MKKIKCYKTSYNGNTDIGHFLKEKRYESYEDAKKAVEDAWDAYRPRFVNLDGRFIIHEYIRDDKDVMGYQHQIVVVYKGFANIINLMVDPSIIIIN